MSDSPPPRRPTYEGGIPALLEQMEARRDPLVYGPDEALPPLDVELGPLKEQRVLRPSHDPTFTPPRTTYARKRKALRREFKNEPEICYLNGMLIANLRRREAPAHCAALFRRLWEEEAAFLIDHLDARWLVSSIATFGDHGSTEAQRRVGSSLSVLFNTMKLYESERLYSGRGADEPFPLAGRAKSPLPLAMDRFAMENGGLDVNILGALWREAEKDAVIRPLAHHLLTELIHDPYTVFRRLRQMRARKERQREKREAMQPQDGTDTATTDGTGAKSQDTPRQVMPNEAPSPRAAEATGLPRWGIVSMSNAEPDVLLGFVAHHLELGASHVALYLDGLHPEGLEPLRAHPAVDVTLCDEAWWEAHPRPRMPAHQLRQGYCATQAYRAAKKRGLDWITHIDTDEYLLPEDTAADAPVAQVLAALAPDRLCVRAVPVEALAPLDDSLPRYFKRLPHSADQSKAVMEDIAPTFGRHLRQGFISHTTGKVFARTGLGRVRLGIHALRIAGQEKDYGAPLEGLVLGHFHSPGWAHFRRTLDFRLSRGSYRKRDAEWMKLHDILVFLREEEGEEGLRRLYAELCEARPEVLERFAAHDMLLDQPIDPQAAAARVFGPARREAGE